MRLIIVTVAVVWPSAKAHKSYALTFAVRTISAEAQVRNIADDTKIVHRMTGGVIDCDDGHKGERINKMDFKTPINLIIVRQI